MRSYVRPACLAVAFVATAVPASAQTWIYEPDVPRARVYEPRYGIPSISAFTRVHSPA